MAGPRLSILIPTYNYAHYLPSCIESILAQEYQDYELIFIDDGSTDETWEVLQRYAKRSQKIRLVRLAHNEGIFKASSYGLKVAQGSYLHFFSSDDLYVPSSLTAMMSLFESNPSLSCACSDMNYLSEKSGEIKYVQLLTGMDASHIFSPQEVLKYFQTTPFWIPGTTCVIQKEAFLRHAPFDPQLENLCDWYLFHRIALLEGVGYLPQPLVTMRVHDKTYTSVVKKNKKRRRACYRHLLHKIERDKVARAPFMQSGLLAFVWRELKWRRRLDPRYLLYRPYLKKKERSRVMPPRVFTKS